MRPSFDPTARPTQAVWDVSSDSAFIEDDSTESGLLSEQSQVADSAVLQLLEQFYGLKGDLVRIPTEKDETFRLQNADGTYLVKLSPADEDPAIVQLQTACMEHLEQNAPELPVQRMVRNLGGGAEVHVPTPRGPFDRVLRVMAYMPGLMLANDTPGSLQLQSVGASLARLNRALEDFDHPQADRRLLWDLKHFHRMRPLLDYVDDTARRGLAEEIFDRFEEGVVPLLGTLTSQVIHGDFSPFNILVDPSSPDYVTGIIDFGDAVRTPVIFDISVTMANLLGADPDRPWGRAVRVLEGYQNLRPLPVHEVEALNAAAPARLLLRALITQWRAAQLPERRDYLLSHSKPDWDRLASTAAVPAPTAN